MRGYFQKISLRGVYHKYTLTPSIPVAWLISFSLQYWRDEHLTWNPQQYGGQQRINVSPDIIWKPDITAPNGPNAFRFDNSKVGTVLIEANGYVNYWSDTRLQTYCMTSLTHFPDDTQRCRVTLEPFFTYNYVDLKTYEHYNVSTYAPNRVWIENPEWQFINLIS